MPETVIRALSQGAEASLILSVVEAESVKFLCLAMKVQDEPDSPFAASMPKSDADEIGLLRRALHPVPLRCTASTNSTTQS